ncbi:MAG: hypothetical protein IIV23_01540, partial [Ruminococcus sp.]|nr:hypothetical protein [Ruminococcus sp.]
MHNHLQMQFPMCMNNSGLIISLTSTGLLRCILAKLPPHTEKAEFMRCAVPFGTALFLVF